MTAKPIIALDWYNVRLELHQRLAGKIQKLLEELLASQGIQFNTVEARVKTCASFLEKASKKSQDGRTSKYLEPTTEIRDVVGVRVITYLDSAVDQVCKLIGSEFEVDPNHSVDKDTDLGTDRVGYRSKHFVATLGQSRTLLAEYSEFANVPFEIQIRSLLQHAWAVMEHDRRFKFPDELPAPLGRQFSLLAGLLEIADQGFNKLVADIDDQRAKAAQLVGSPNDNEPLTTSIIASYMGNLFQTQIELHSIEATFGMSSPPIVQELDRFGVSTLGNLSDLISEEFAGDNTILEAEYNNFTGILRNAMVISDAHKYFNKAWDKSWTVLSASSVAMYEAKKVPIHELVEMHDLQLGDDNAYEHDHDFDPDHDFLVYEDVPF